MTTTHKLGLVASAILLSTAMSATAGDMKSDKMKKADTMEKMEMEDKMSKGDEMKDQTMAKDAMKKKM